jgi:hypothetical protein
MPVSSTLRFRRFRDFDGFDAVALVALGVLSAWLLFVLLARQDANHVWTGTDGPYVGDQLQYLAWIREASHHVLIADPFRVEPSGASFLHPGLVLSGVLLHLGVSPSVSYLLWKPIAVVALFAAARAYVGNFFPSKPARRCALVLALFYLSPTSLIAAHLHWTQLVSFQSIVFEMWPALYLWGYPFTALAVAALVATLLAYGRDRDSGRSGVWAPLLGFTCAWLQPWQGTTVIAIVLLTEAVLWIRGSRVNPILPAVTVGATAVPLVYYSALSHFDSTWRLAGAANRVALAPNWTLLAALAPLAVPALLAYVRPASSFQEIAVRAWPFAALGVYYVIGLTHVGTFPLHALQGLSVPFAVLAVIGVRGIPWRLPAPAGTAVAIALVALLVVPSMVHELDATRSLGKPTAFGRVPFFLTSGEHRALEYVRRSPLRGAVLAPVFLGETVPAETGRHTWVGLASWTPDYGQRIAAADRLFAGSMSSGDTQRFVASAGVTFMVSDCHHTHDLTASLGALLVDVEHFGCATVYQVR